MRKKARKQRIQEIRQIQKLKHEKKNLSPGESSGFKHGYCLELIEYCSQGYSFESFASRINVMPEILEEWTEKYPEFKKARALAAFKQKTFWEMKAVEACNQKFLISVFRYFTGSKDENPPLSGPVVILPKEDNSK
ncbi:MAG: hypothetical protein ACM3P0_07910 [Acidobacteriota bacterium]